MTSHPYNEPAFPAPGPPYVPGMRTRAQRRQDTGALPLATPSMPPVPAPAPRPADDTEDKLVPWERAIDLIKNVVVIITCTVLLYGAWSVYNALAQLSEQVGQFRL